MKISTRWKRGLMAVLLLGSFGMSQQALAHKLNVFAYAEGESVSVEGYFADGRKTQNSSVKVLDGSGKVLVEGVTDSEGRYRFKTPEHTDIKIVLNAGMGHQGEFAMSAEELAVGATSAAPVQSAADHGGAGSASVSAASAGNGELEAVVQHAVNEAIKPLVRELAESQQKASISELVGAIGYIFGVLGLFAFYKSRQMTTASSATQKSDQG